MTISTPREIILFLRGLTMEPYFPYCQSPPRRNMRNHSVGTTRADSIIPTRYTAVQRSRNPITRSRVIIHSPGFGINLSSPGRRDSTRYGSDIPVPTERNITKITPGGCSSAQASVAPRNGPLQGVARKVARTPLKKASP